MAASMPLSFNSQIPVTPPPDHQMFMKDLPPKFSKPFPGIHQNATTTTTATIKPEEKSAPTPPTYSASSGAHLSQQPSSHRQCPFPQPPPPSRPHHFYPLQPTTTSHQPPISTLPISKPSSSPAAPPSGQQQIDPATAATAIDPRYIAMASRIASYYQQRCQAVANYQQQRCQQWANAQRAKSQEMTQAAMLIVAWYIRDRIQRRRRRQKRSFKKRLAQKALNSPSPKITKGEGVRRWVMGVPLGAGAASPTCADRSLPKDVAERDFDLDRVMLDGDGADGKKKDDTLFNVADNLIKSQLARIDVPLLGVLDFDESESETSESEDEEMELEEEEEEEDEEEEEEEDYENEYEEYEELTQEKAGVVEGKKKGKEIEEATASLSKNAQLGTTTGTTRNRSESSVP